jgi:3-isopropylmalate/(R)-2-methylmalate dehydratase large subunit
MHIVSGPRTLYQKIWTRHLVHEDEQGNCLIYVDRHLVHEVTSPVAFSALRQSGRSVRRPDATFAIVDHGVPSDPALRRGPIRDAALREQIDTLERNAADFGIRLISANDPQQGIVHVVGPELGLTLPGCTIACGDSHTTTHGALGALAFGIGTSEIEHVLATQTLRLRPSKSMRLVIDGKLPFGATAKDLILAIIGKIGADGAIGHAVEFAGPVIAALSIEARMTICNMSVEAGARAGLIAPDETTYRYLAGRANAPRGDLLDRATEDWRTLVSDPGAIFDHEVAVTADDIEPQVTWGTNPEQVAPISGEVPSPQSLSDPAKRAAAARALDYMGLKPGTRMTDIRIDRVFIGSCTNGQIEDIRAAARVAKDRKVAPWVKAMVVPGSQLVKRRAEEEGLDKILTAAGFAWREPSCSMCAGFNGDEVGRGEHCASTSNRNFEGRQGSGARTHLVSPAMAAAAAVVGRLADVRKLIGS